MRRNRFLGAVAARTLFVSNLIGITRASPPPMSTDFAPRPKRAHQACPVGSHRSGGETASGACGHRLPPPLANPVAGSWSQRSHGKKDPEALAGVPCTP